jgi:hypothetical protein
MSQIVMFWRTLAYLGLPHGRQTAFHVKHLG